jgi:hypothetical protein
MLKSLPILGMVALLLTGANGCSDKQTATEESYKAGKVPVTQTSQQAAEHAFSKTFSGHIAGKFGITMTLTRKGNALTGSYYYNKVKQSIAISGNIQADGILTLEERDAKGVVTGIFEGTLFSDSELTGNWSKPDSNKPLPFSLKETAGAAEAQQDVEVMEYSFSLKGKDDMVADFSFPQVKGNINAAILNKINEQLSVKNLTDEQEEEIKKNFAECSCGLINSSYVVNYNQSSLLSLTVVSEWMAAYSSFNTKYINIHLATGEPIKVEQLLSPASFDKIIKLADKILQERIAETKKEAAGTDEEEWVNELLTDKKFERVHLQNFTIHDNGITFYYPFHFPHAALALEPEGAIGFTFEQLNDFIDENGLLGMKKK